MEFLTGVLLLQNQKNIKKNRIFVYIKFVNDTIFFLTKWKSTCQYKQYGWEQPNILFLNSITLLFCWPIITMKKKLLRECCLLCLKIKCTEMAHSLPLIVSVITHDKQESDFFMTMDITCFVCDEYYVITD